MFCNFCLLAASCLLLECSGHAKCTQLDFHFDWRETVLVEFGQPLGAARDYGTAKQAGQGYGHQELGIPKQRRQQLCHWLWRRCHLYRLAKTHSSLDELQLIHLFCPISLQTRFARWCDRNIRRSPGSRHRHPHSQCSRPNRLLPLILVILVWLDHQAMECKGTKNLPISSAKFILINNYCCRKASHSTHWKIMAITFTMLPGHLRILPCLQLSMAQANLTCGIWTRRQRHPLPVLWLTVLLPLTRFRGPSLGFTSPWATITAKSGSTMLERFVNLALMDDSNFNFKCLFLATCYSPCWWVE